MKKILVIFLLSISSLSFAHTYYVSITGNNANDGLTTTTPWQTIQYAELHAIAAGDIIALKRGDTWSTNLALGIHHGGISGNPVIWDGSLWGSGSNAIIQSSANRTGSNISIVNIIGCSYLTFRNITINGNNTYAFGLVIGGTDNMYSPGGVQNAEKGITVQNCSILNIGNGINYAIGLLCQTWHNGISDITLMGNTFDGADDEQLSFYGGKSSDGGTPAECKNVYIGFNNLTNWGKRGQSTGYGLQLNNKITNVIVENNTLTTGIYGHGHGMQIESNETLAGWFPTGVIIRYNKISSTPDNAYCIYMAQGQAKTVDVYSNLLLSSTKTSNGGGIWVGASASPKWDNAKLNFYNNTIYSLGGRSFTNDCDVAGVVTLKNNLFYNAGNDDYGMMCLVNNTAGSATHSNNLYYRSVNPNYTKVKDGATYAQTSVQVLSWEAGSIPSDPLFVTPGTDFRLLPGSSAIGTGVSIPGITKDLNGASFKNPPDIGCYQSSGTAAAPIHNNSTVENALPLVIGMTYDLTLDNSAVPPVSSFDVKINSVSRPVSAIAVAGNKVLLTLTSAVIAGVVVTVSYTKPATNPIKSAAGQEAASLSAQSVVNNVNPVQLPASPVYIQSVIDPATPNNIAIIYDPVLADVVPLSSAFNVKINSVARPLNSVAIQGGEVVLTLSSAPVSGDIVTVSYTKPAVNPLQTSSGGQAASTNDQLVTNNIATTTSTISAGSSDSNIQMTIYPNPAHHIFNLLIKYPTSFSIPDAIASSQILRIFDFAGKLVYEKMLTPGIAAVNFPINIKSGIYIVQMALGTTIVSSKKLLVNN
jgi:uncharacterized repeat protein (TIGR02059 family)